jgi:hypothetical protein
MTKILSQYMHLPEADAAKVINKLEGLAGYPSEDVRLLADIRQATAAKIAQLGLDPQDTTSEELHHALLQRASADCQRLSAAIGRQTQISADAFNQKLIDLVNHMPFNPEVLALKNNTAKDLLRQNPPKQLMKLLGYRSLESMLKREDTAELYALLPFTQSTAWMNGFWGKHAKLKASDFELRRMSFVLMPEKRYKNMTPQTGLVTVMLQLGVAAVWPVSPAQHNYNYSLSVMLVQAAEMMQIYSCSLKLEQFKPAFGKVVVANLQHRLVSPAVIEQVPVPWSALHHHYGKKLKSAPALLAPHVQTEDLRRHSAAELLATVQPSFGWWVDNDHLASLAGGKLQSLNLGDVLLSHINGANLGAAFNHNVKHHVWEELISRYLQHTPIESYALAQLGVDNAYAELETGRVDFSSKKQPTMHEFNFI